MPIPLSQVKTLPYYGRHFPFIPWKLTSKLRISLVFAGNLLRDLGLISFVGFWLALPFRAIPTYRASKAGFRLMGSSFGLIAEMEWIPLVIIYRVLEKRHGKAHAYDFAKEAIQKSSLLGATWVHISPLTEHVSATCEAVRRDAVPSYKIGA